MSRRGKYKKREVPPDPIYNDESVHKLINNIMWDGKKTVAEKIVYGAFDIVRERKKDNPLKVWKMALENVKPIMETKSRRVGGATYQVPVEVPPDRRLKLAIKWIVRAARSRSEKRMVDRLANEIMDASEGKGGAVRKREEVHRIAESNKAFIHYRW